VHESEANYWNTKLHRGVSRRSVLRSASLGFLGVGGLGLLGCSSSNNNKAAGTTTAAGSAAVASGAATGSPTAASTRVVGTAAIATAAGTPASQAIVPTGKLVVNLASPTDGLQYFNPMWYTSGNQWSYKSAIGDALVNVGQQNGNMSFYPALSSGWEISPDGLTVTFHLRPEAQFHDGTPVTSTDVKYCYDLILSDASPQARKSEWKAVYKSVETPDARTAVVQLTQPYPLLTRLNIMWPIIPAALYEKVGPDGLEQHPIGTGPFKFVSGTKGQTVTLTAVTPHYRKTPFIKDLVFTGTGEEASRVAQLQTGESNITTVTPVNEKQITGSGGRIISTKNSGVQFLEFMDMFVGKTDSPTNDLRVRQAMSKAVNRKDITSRLLGGQAVPAGSISYPDIPGYLDLPPDDYDLTTAKQLLTAAGYGNGFATDFYTTPPVSDAVTTMVGDWQKIGITINLKTLDGAAFVGLINGHKTPGVYIQGQGMITDAAMDALFVFSTGTFSYINDPDLDKVMSQVTNGADETKRASSWGQVQQTIHDKGYYMPLWFTGTDFALDSKLKEWQPEPYWAVPSGFEYARV
jgi:peptide/nickel transport system substrate-binding protein